MARWVRLDENRRGWLFYCSACGGLSYWPQPTRGKRKPGACPYPMCPWCGERMEADDGIQDEN